MRKECPECHAILSEDDLRADPLVCPTCKAQLKVYLKANWAYTVLSYAIAVVITMAEGYDSLAFAFRVLIYGTIILFLIKYCRWELHLPIRLLTVLDCRFWSEDKP